MVWCGKRLRPVLIALLLAFRGVLYPVPGPAPVFEIDQLLTPRIGVAGDFSPGWGVRGSAGVSPLGFPTVACGCTLVRHCRGGGAGTAIDLEAGLPLLYFNAWEGRSLDCDPIIDDPYLGLVPGGGVALGRRLDRGTLALFAGVGCWREWQRGEGWKSPRVMPLVSLRYELRGALSSR